MRTKMNRSHLEKLSKDETIITLQAHLLKSAMEWVEERSKDPKTLTPVEKELGDTALTLIDQIKRLVEAS